MTLPTDSDARNGLPVWDGVIAYFPDVWAEIAKVSVIGNKQHNLGDKLHFNRDVSTDHANKVMRHMLDDAAGIRFDEDGTYHLAKAAWRALAALQVVIETKAGKSAARLSAARLSDGKLAQDAGENQGRQLAEQLIERDRDFNLQQQSTGRCQDLQSARSAIDSWRCSP